MKHSFKKLFSILAAFMMVVGLGLTTVKAEGETYSITVNPAVEGATYTAYKLFDATYEGDNVSYKATDTQKNALPVSVKNLFTFTPTTTDGVNNVTTSNSAEDITSAIRAAIKAGEWTIESAGSATTAKGATTTTISLTEPGYYYVTSSVGTLIGVTTAKPTATIKEKNEHTPVVVKKADGNETGTAEVGKVVNYTIDVTIQPGAQKYVLTDVMTGLTYNNDVTVKNGDTSLGSNATTSFNDATSTLTVTFDQDYLDGITAATTITVAYTATVNESAVTVNKAENTATLNYGTNNNTTSDTVTLSNYGFGLMKTKSDANNKELLEGATFNILNGGTVLKFVHVSDGDYYRPAKANETGAVTDIPAGNVKFDGLANGTYTIHEVAAPAGYKIATKDETITITDGDEWVQTEQVTVNDSQITAYKEGGVRFVNEAGSSLPSTGGMGTTLLYTVGGALVVGAAIILITKKRMAA